MYARYPPEDFDWVRYYDKLRLKTRPSASRAVSTDGEQMSRGGAAINEGPHRRRGGTTDTQTTTAVVSSDDLFSDIHQQDEHHHVGGRLIKVSRASSSVPKPPKPPDGGLHMSSAVPVAQSPGPSKFIRSNTTPARFGNGITSTGKAALSKSSTVHSNSEHLSSTKVSPRSAIAPSGAVASSGNLNGMNNNAPKSKGFGKKISNIFGRKKSSGAE